MRLPVNKNGSFRYTNERHNRLESVDKGNAMKRVVLMMACLVAPCVIGNDVPKRSSSEMEDEDLPIISGQHKAPLNPTQLDDFTVILGNSKYTFKEPIRSIVTSDTQMWVNGICVKK